MLPWEPWAKKRPRVSRSVAGKARRTHQDPADKKAEDRTREFLQENWSHPPATGNLSLSVFFFRSTRHIVDLDNLLKHLLDSGNGILWRDDSQVTAFDQVEIHLDRDAPRTWFELADHVTTMTRE